MYYIIIVHRELPFSHKTTQNTGKNDGPPCIQYSKQLPVYRKNNIKQHDQLITYYIVIN